jgi:alanine racemase
MTLIRSTVADVDLDAIAHNLGAFAARGERVIAAVKADAYGHGAEAVSRALVEAGAEMLAVFTVEEAVVLRRAAIGGPILVLGGVTGRAEAEAALAEDLTIVVWDEARALLLSDAARAAGRSARAHFKVDTGLTRLGAPHDEALARYARIRALPGIAIDGVFTHFASADKPGDTFTREQLDRFEGIVAALPERPRLVHAAATAGALLLDESRACNAVRPGLGLYGLRPAPHLATRDLRPALRWTSRVHRLARAAKGAGVSYGHAYRLPRDGLVATVPVGYGDGLPRAASGRARLLVRGCAVPIAGRVAMDMVMLDVTDVAGVAEGDEVVVIGEQGRARVSAEDLATACDTINYEVVTNIRRRVPRRYLRGGRVVATRTLGEGIEWS